MQIVDPWGSILCEIKDGIGVATAEIELNQLNSVRQNLPVTQHARNDLYQVSQAPGAITSMFRYQPDNQLRAQQKGVGGIGAIVTLIFITESFEKNRLTVM